MAAGAGAAAAAAIANAIKASGVVVRVSPEDFERILSRAEKPLVVVSQGGLFTTNYQYLTSYKGFAFFTKSRMPFQLSPKVEVIMANRIWIPA